jgi:retron-type reverse transcriptase
MMLKPFNEFADVSNLYTAWRQFRSGKRDRDDVVVFERRLERELSQLSEDLLSGTYVHGEYFRFFVRDPKFRAIHKACVRDRVVHQALYNVLYPIFDKKFFFDSYSSRIGKGTHAAIKRIWRFMGKESHNFKREVYVFHGDIDNFFSSIDHDILFGFLCKNIRDRKFLNLCKLLIMSYNSESVKGIPLGNLTSQVFANVYLHELDFFVKQTCGIRYYARYNDDFFIVSEDKDFLKNISKKIQEFLASELKMSMPDNKILITKLSDGVDILGAVAFPHGLVPRRRIKRAALAVAEKASKTGYTTTIGKQLNSYIGLLGQSKSYLLRQRLRTSIGVNY